MSELKYYHNYELTYQDIAKENISFNPNQSLISYYENEVFERLTFSPEETAEILEVGCGAGTIFQDQECPLWNILGIDISITAIELANSNNQKDNFKFELQDCCTMNYCDQFDLIVDGHLLHCLTDDQDRLLALKNIKKALKPGGQFMLETMCSHKNISFDADKIFEEDILYTKTSFDFLHDIKVINDENHVPFRKIKTALEIEQELLDAGFKIVYLYVYSNLKLIPSDSRVDALSSDPDVIRVICTKESLDKDLF